MENILEKLYELHIKTEHYPFGIPSKEETKEWALYNELQDKLSDELKIIFVEYTNLCELRHNSEKKAVYEYGFKTAIQLIAEAFKQ